MRCKFCKGNMHHVEETRRILVCNECGYFETDRTPLSTTLEYPQLKLYPATFAEALANGAF